MAGPVSDLKQWSESLWKTYLLTILGDFDAEDYMVNAFAQVFFFAIIFIIQIIMLNVLITIVGDGYVRSELRAASLFCALC